MFPRDCENGDAELEKCLDKIADENFLQMRISRPQSLFQYLLIRNKK